MGKGIYGKGGYKSFDEMMDRARRAEFIPFDDIAEDKMIEEGGSFHCSAIDYPLTITPFRSDTARSLLPGRNHRGGPRRSRI